MAEDRIDYGLETIAPDSYVLTMTMEVGHRVFDQIMGSLYRKMMPKARDLNMQLEDDYSFRVDEKHLNVLHAILKSKIRQIQAEVRKDGIICTSDKVTKGTFTKKKEGWTINILVGGIVTGKHQRLS